ncbi:MlaA family lipoprotein [Lysobacter solisilvae (ex Woo and Kim 2020)]|uniref:VacJ family lipoprotein n=1 Tax=Agrilutibacter terrestris TaxID=2865112 RepID=A0A7H0G1G8_9GAMM|nr:VacJ family lipoprotein [Lysobacter terrestris]QNP42134.1 VacJ family lipoprotein [Lysobacter terrestris]
MPQAPVPTEATTPAPASESPVADTATPGGPAPESEATIAPDDDAAASDGVAAVAQSDTATGETPPLDPQTTEPAQSDAEQAFADIYGTQEYGDPNLPDAAEMPGTFDPWERYNRRMHRFNNAVDRGIARPLARGYVKVVPRPVRLGVSNFFNNLSQPLTMVNSLLQGKPKQAGQSLGRFLLNSTVGIGGIFDPASRAKIPQKSEDFGQTLGVWGWKRSRYFELPLFGPRTVRDVFGMAGDAPLSPLRQVEADRIRIPLQGLQLVDVRAQLLSTDSLREGAEDDYTLVRDAWSQRRDYQIFGDRAKADGSDLPDYLREDEDDSTVPVDAIPVVVPGGG